MSAALCYWLVAWGFVGGFAPTKVSNKGRGSETTRGGVNICQVYDVHVWNCRGQTRQFVL